MTTDLTDIDGVGPARADSLREAGFDVAEDVATSTLDDLEEPLGPSVDPEEIRSNALDATADDASAEDAVEDATSDGTSSNRDEVRVLDVPNRETAYYLVKGLIDENLRLKKRNEYDEVDAVNDVIDRLMKNIDEEGGTIQVDLDDLSVLYTSVRNIEQEFQGSRGITDLVGSMRDVRIDIQDLRSDLWPDSDD